MLQRNNYTYDDFVTIFGTDNNYFQLNHFDSNVVDQIIFDMNRNAFTIQGLSLDRNHPITKLVSELAVSPSSCEEKKQNFIKQFSFFLYEQGFSDVSIQALFKYYSQRPSYIAQRVFYKINNLFDEHKLTAVQLMRHESELNFYHINGKAYFDLRCSGKIFFDKNIRNHYPVLLTGFVHSHIALCEDGFKIRNVSLNGEIASLFKYFFDKNDSNDLASEYFASVCSAENLIKSILMVSPGDNFEEQVKWSLSNKSSKEVEQFIHELLNPHNLKNTLKFSEQMLDKKLEQLRYEAAYVDQVSDQEQKKGRQQSSQVYYHSLLNYLYECGELNLRAKKILSKNFEKTHGITKVLAIQALEQKFKHALQLTEQRYFFNCLHIIKNLNVFVDVNDFSKHSNIDRAYKFLSKKKIDELSEHDLRKYYEKICQIGNQQKDKGLLINLMTIRQVMSTRLTKIKHELTGLLNEDHHEANNKLLN